MICDNNGYDTFEPKYYLRDNPQKVQDRIITE